MICEWGTGILSESVVYRSVQAYCVAVDRRGGEKRRGWRERREGEEMEKEMGGGREEGMK